MSCKSPLVWFCNIPIGRFSPIFSLKTTKARVIQNEACKYIGVKPDLYGPIEEDVKAELECIAYQITDLTLRMAQDAGLPLSELRADGGPTANKYLMQFQSDIAQVTVSVSDVAELSGFGAACAAGFSCGLYDPETILANMHRSCFTPEMDHTEREARYNGWQKAVRQALTH